FCSPITSQRIGFHSDIGYQKQIHRGGSHLATVDSFRLHEWVVRRPSALLHFRFLLHAVEFPSADDRGDGAAAFDVVVVEGQINMHDDEGYKEPEEEMVPEAH